MKKSNLPSLSGGVTLAVAMLLSNVPDTHANVNFYTGLQSGYITETYSIPGGIIAVNNHGNDISLIADGQLKTLVCSPGAGRYINVSPDGKSVGFKSINDNADQAPALLEIATGRVSLLADYAPQCGQVSFANDGSIAYTVGNSLFVRRDNQTTEYPLGAYVNICNISPDGSRAAYTGFDGECRILDLSTGDSRVVYNQGACRAQWAPDGSKLAISRTNGQLACYDTDNEGAYELGEVNSVAWSKDSRHLIVSRSVRANDLEVCAASVQEIDFQGSSTATIISDNADIPVSVSMADNGLLVSYITGSRRGVQRIPVAHGVFSAPAKSTTVFAAPADMRIGMSVTAGGWGAPSDPEAVAEANPMDNGSDTPAPNGIGLTDIPYINQVDDTPYVDGSLAYGYVCCAPSSSCMLLGYYKLLPDDPDRYTRSRAFRPAEKYNKYSYYVAKKYTSPQTNYTFSQTAYGNGTPNVSGGYGFMWSSGSPFSHLADFHIKNGVESSQNEYNETYPNNIIVRECTANRPYIICLKNGTGGHVVLAFRANQIANSDGTTVEKVGSFVCNDPYGNYNVEYPSYNGRHASYDLPGYNNGVKNIGVFYWGTVTSVKDAGVSDIMTDSADMPKISVDNGVITVSGSGTDAIDVEVYTFTGVKAYSGRADRPVSGLAPGQYIVRAGGATAKVVL